MESVNYFQAIIASVWQIMNTEFTLYGFTLSYGKIFLFTVISCFAMRALYILWFD